MTSRRMLTIGLVALALAACQPTASHPVPSVAQIGADLHCTSGDHGFEDSQLGWGFCYPGTWKYTERAQSVSPTEFDLTFSVTDIPCTSPSPVTGNASPRPDCSPGAGLFAYMIVSTYDRGSASNLTSWIQANLTPAGPTPATPTPASPTPGTASPSAPPALEPIQWGNSSEAGRMADGRRIALTPHHVVLLDLRTGVGLLDLETAMSTRLGTWKFTF